MEISALYYLLMSLMVGIVLGLGFYYVGKKVFEGFWKYDVEIDHLSSDGLSRLQMDWARKTSYDGVELLKTWKNKDFIDLPTKGTVSYNLTGRRKINVYKYEDGTYSYGGKTFPDKNLKPLTTAQRNVMIIQAKKAANRKTVDKWLQYLPALGGISMIIIMMIFVFAFWENLYKPAKQAQEINADIMTTLGEISKNNLRVTQMVYEIQTGKQLFTEDTQIIGGEGGTG